MHERPDLGRLHRTQALGLGGVQMEFAAGLHQVSLRTHEDHVEQLQVGGLHIGQMQVAHDRFLISRLCGSTMFHDVLGAS